jgi:hypothetical protein
MYKELAISFPDRRVVSAHYYAIANPHTEVHSTPAVSKRSLQRRNTTSSM